MPLTFRSLRVRLSPYWPDWLRRAVGRSRTFSWLEGEAPLCVLRSRAEWEELTRRQPRLADEDHVAAIVEQGRRNGVQSRMLGFIPPEKVRVESSNYREGFLAAGFNPRQRAVMDRLLDFPVGHEVHGARLHLHEALTGFALLFRGRYPRAFCSEYAADAQAAQALFPIPIVDITASGLPSASFDVVLTQEVLEHVPDLDAALADMARILKPGGIALGTFPFDPGSDVTHVKAIMEDGAVRHLEPPEYHGNPTDPEGGSLVFQIPGWDVLERARRAGFSDARIVAIHSPARGIVAAGMAPVLLFEAER